MATFWNLTHTIRWVSERDLFDLRLDGLHLDMQHLGRISKDSDVEVCGLPTTTDQREYGVAFAKAGLFGVTRFVFEDGSVHASYRAFTERRPLWSV